MSSEGPIGDAGAGERVRFCLECGSVLPFQQTRCSVCGHVEAAPPLAAALPEAGAAPASLVTGSVMRCPACGAAMAAELLFCPSCGVDVGDRGHHPRPVAPPAADTGGGAVATLSVVLALLAPLFVLLALAELLLTGAR